MLNDRVHMDFAGIADAFERTFVTYTHEAIVSDLPE